MQSSHDFAVEYLQNTLPLFREYESENFVKAMDLIEDAYRRDATVYICGNGGSASTAGHMVNDLSKGASVEGKRRIRCHGLSDSIALVTTYGNDCGYETIFVEQLKNLWRPGDLLIAISASGNSPNVVRAAEYAKRNGSVIGLVGFSGGKLKENSTVSIHFKSYNYGSVEDCQLMFSHLSSQYMYKFIEKYGETLNVSKPFTSPSIPNATIN
ncbi:MAG: hypothetical protein A4S09_02570 [Proteobacteria bacterium SG_bin7]|nr:MAG: hypothetical protein A4S09_02570 [Proteobacteria bacterium SG_bin7]